MLCGDFDGDNDIDILVSQELRAPYWFKNDGSENFSSHVLSSNTYEANHFDVGDIDSDGELEIVACGRKDVTTDHYGFWAFDFDAAVSSLSPSVNYNRVEADDNIELSFNQSPVQSQLTSANFSVYSQTNGMVTGTTSASESTIAFDPNTDFTAGM